MFTSIGAQYLQKFNVSLNAIFTLLFSIIIGVMLFGAISPNQAYTFIAVLVLVTMLYSLYVVIKTRGEFNLIRLLVLLSFIVTVVVACFYVLITNITSV
jgi:hypothetical protein